METLALSAKTSDRNHEVSTGQKQRLYQNVFFVTAGTKTQSKGILNCLLKEIRHQNSTEENLII